MRREPSVCYWWGGPHDGRAVPMLYHAGEASEAFLPCLDTFNDAGALVVRPLGSAERYERDAGGVWRWRGTFIPSDGQAA